MDGRAKKLLNEIGEESPDDVARAHAATYLQSAHVSVLSIFDLYKLIKQTAGDGAAQDFEKMVLTKEMPENRDQLITFFRGRTDLISQSCLEALEKNNGNT